MIIDATFTPRLDTSFSQSSFDSLEMGRSVENPFLLDDEEDKEKSPPTFPVFERTNRPHLLLRSRALGTRIENYPIFVYRKMFQKYFPVYVF